MVISDWLRNRNTIEFLGIWEELHNNNFNYIEFDIIKSKAGLNSFIISVKEWVEKTNAIGIISKAGRYGGTYAHKDIAYHFGMWLSPEFCEIAKSLTNSLFVQRKTKSEFVQMPSAQMADSEIVQMPSAQMEFAPLPSILTITTFSNHLEILNRTHSYQEAVFYMLYAAQQQLTTNELRRSIVSQTYGSIMSKEKQFTPAMLSQYPGASFMLKDRLILDFLNLPQNFIEPQLHEGILKHMRDFILELGKDYVFIGSEYPVKVGGSTKRIDLLFYNRALHCLAAIELKSVDFQAEFISKMDMYLEALDRDVKKADENPSIGIILCPSIDKTMAEYTLSCSLSPTMVSEYQRKLIPRDVLVKSLHDYCRFLDQEISSNMIDKE